ncbi:MAG: stage III sporulation protein AG [Ruthenibacterium sp.]
MDEQTPHKLKWTDLLHKKNALFFVGIAGILLIFLSDNLFAGANTKQKNVAANDTVQNDAAAYVENLETRLTDTLAKVDGAGKVRVMITLDTTGESVYAQNEQIAAETKGEGENNQQKNTRESEHVLVSTADRSETPLLETEWMPEIKGVAVVCEGGGDIVVEKRITELVAVVLGLSSNRICVTKMI